MLREPNLLAASEVLRKATLPRGSCEQMQFQPGDGVECEPPSDGTGSASTGQEGVVSPSSDRCWAAKISN